MEFAPFISDETLAAAEEAESKEISENSARAASLIREAKPKDQLARFFTYAPHLTNEDGRAIIQEVLTRDRQTSGTGVRGLLAPYLPAVLIAVFSGVAFAIGQPIWFAPMFVWSLYLIGLTFFDRNLFNEMKMAMSMLVAFAISEVATAGYFDGGLKMMGLMTALSVVSTVIIGITKPRAD